MATDLSYKATIGEIMKAGIIDLQNMTIAFPTPPPTSPHIDLDMG